MTRGYLTPSTIPETLQCVSFYIPSDLLIRAAVLGAIGELGKSYNWEEFGEITPEEIASYFENTQIAIGDCMLGQIIWTIANPDMEKWHIADGSTLLASEYPHLYAAVNSAWIDVSGNIVLPDLRGKFVVSPDETTINESDTGGESEHTLTEAEMPAHDHIYQQYTFGIDIESVGVPDPTGVGQPLLNQATSIAGNGDPHNNMPPYQAINAYVRVRS